MPEGSGVYQVFAQNLFAHTTRKGSIAQTCRDISINRQQYNKYLAGRAMPGPATLKKLAEHFGIPETDLFVESPRPTLAEVAERRKLPTADSLFALIHSRTREAVHAVDANNLREGCYFAYVPQRGAEHLVLRMLIVVRRIGSIMTFLRTARLNPDDSRFVRSRGIVAESNQRLYWIGQNESALREISILTYSLRRGAPAAPQSGLAILVPSEGSPVATRMVLEHAGPMSAYGRLLRQAHPVPAGSNSLPAAVSDALKTSRKRRAFLTSYSPNPHQAEALF